MPEVSVFKKPQGKQKSAEDGQQFSLRSYREWRRSRGSGVGVGGGAGAAAAVGTRAAPVTAPPVILKPFRFRPILRGALNLLTFRVTHVDGEPVQSLTLAACDSG